MAFFDCIVGGSGKGNTLVVTCADDLAGATITCTNGTKTYRKTCPSTAPYEVTFYGLEAGTWTVSATVSGNTYTTTVVVADIEAELGGFNWKTWVDLSENYTSSDFTDLDDLLSDETAVRELMTIHACVDYLADIATTSADVETIIGNDLCAKWINNRDYALDTLYANEIIADYMDTADKYFYGEWVITDNTTTPPTWGAKGNVPVMTSNIAPYGEVIYGSVTTNTGHDPYRAFDGNQNGTDWNSAYSGGSIDISKTWIGYKFVNPVNIKKIDLCVAKETTYTDWFSSGTFNVLASNDNSTWETLATGLTWEYPNNQMQPFTINNDDYYLYYKLVFTSYMYGNGTSSKGCVVAELQFYGRELSVSVPVMTSNTAPYGEANANTEQSGTNNYKAFNAFDGNSNTFWSCDVTTAANTNYFGYDFGRKIVPKFFKFNPLTAGQTATITFKIQGSNDNFVNDIHDLTETVTITTSSSIRYANENSVNAIVTFFSNTNEYRYVRYWQISNTYKFGDFQYANAGMAQFYGLDYSEKEFEEGTTKKWLYDHGVELETLDFGTAVKGDSYVYFNHINSVLTDEINPHSKINLTPYSRVRIKTAGRNVWAYVNSAYGFIAVSNAKNVPYTQWSGYTDISPALISSCAPNNISYDISSFNEEKYISIGSTDTTVRKWDISEWWLE